MYSGQRPLEGTTVRGSEGARRATGEALTAARPNPDPQVEQRPIRRRMSVAYKLKVIQKVEGLKGEGHGSVGSYLRKEGLYYSSVRKWKQESEDGTLGMPRKSGKPRKERESLLRENKLLRRKMEQMDKKLAKQELIIELQKKISDIVAIDEPGENGVGRR